jgi:hypothetical protein
MSDFWVKEIKFKFVYLAFNYTPWYSFGASVAKWLAHLPFTSKAAGSNLSENFSM